MKQFAVALNKAAEVYNEPMSAERIRGYWEALRSYPEDHLVAAIQAASRRCQFFPRPAEIAGIVKEQAAARRERMGGASSPPMTDREREFTAAVFPKFLLYADGALTLDQWLIELKLASVQHGVPVPFEQFALHGITLPWEVSL